jgi:hypothetical protein
MRGENFVPLDCAFGSQNSVENRSNRYLASRSFALSFADTSSYNRPRDSVIDAFKSSDKKIAVLGAPIDIGASQRGTLMGPAALRTAGLLTLLEGLGFEVEDHGDLSIGDGRPG